MKRLVMILVCLAMLVPAAGLPAAAAEQTEAGGRTGLLGALGLAGWDSEAGDLTRGELAQIAAVLNGADGATPGRDLFTDVTAERADYGYIAYSCDRGYLSGFPGGVFRPDSAAARDSLIQIVMDALGYGPLVEANGGGVAEYVRTAVRCGIRISSGSGGISRAEAAAFLLDALEANAAEPVAISPGGVDEYQTTRTLLEVRFHVFRRDGVLADDGLSSLTGASKAARGNVIVDGLLISDPSGLGEEKLGRYVEAYYRETGSADRTLLFLTEGKKSQTLTLTADEFSEIDPSSLILTYEPEASSRQQRVRLDPNYDVIYNRCADDSFDPAAFDPKNGTVTLIDNDGDRQYDVLSVTEYEVCVVKQVSAAEKKLFSYLNSAPIDVAENTDAEVLIEDTEGEAMALNQIRRWDVVSVAASKNGRYRRLIVCRETVTGSIQEYRTQDGEARITVGETTYRVSDAVYNKYGKPLELGVKLTLYLDFEQTVVAFAAPVARYAYIYGAAKEGLFEDSYRLKTFESDGVWYERTLADKVLYNDIEVDDKTAFQKLEAVRQELASQDAETAKWHPVAKIELSGKGEIDTIVDSTVLRQGGSDLRRANFYGGNNSFTGSGNVGEDAMISGDTVVFFLPEYKSELNEYFVTDSSYFTDGQYFAIASYDISRFSSGLLVIDAERSDPEWRFRNRKNLVVGEVAQGLNAEGSPVLQLSGYLQSRTYASDNTYDRVAEILKFPNEKPGTGVQEGDVVTLVQDAKGEITDARLLFDVNQAYQPHPMKSFDGDAFRVYGGYVEEYDPETKRIWMADCPYHSMMSTNMSVYLFNTETKKLSTFVASDIIPGDYVCIVVRYDVIYDVVVYRK